MFQVLSAYIPVSKAQFVSLFRQKPCMRWICRQLYATADGTYDFYWISVLNFYDLKSQSNSLCKAKYVSRGISISINLREKCGVEKIL
jgi:hypothetical protein